MHFYRKRKVCRLNHLYAQEYSATLAFFYLFIRFLRPITEESFKKKILHTELYNIRMSPFNLNYYENWNSNHMT